MDGVDVGCQLHPLHRRCRKILNSTYCTPQVTRQNWCSAHCAQYKRWLEPHSTLMDIAPDDRNVFVGLTPANSEYYHD
jgi:hypothetical protein